MTARIFTICYDERGKLVRQIYRGVAWVENGKMVFDPPLPANVEYIQLSPSGFIVSTETLNVNRPSLIKMPMKAKWKETRDG